MAVPSVPSTPHSVKLLELFYRHLSDRPYCSDYLPAGLQIRPRDTAIKRQYIQPNGPTHRRWMVFDLDHAVNPATWLDAYIPPPHIIIGRYDCDHSYHYLYFIDPPLRTARDGSPHAQDYWTAVYTAVGSKLEADPCYVGLVCKNPLHPHWWSMAMPMADAPYSLERLSRGLDLAQKKKKSDLYIGEGRNCDLFHTLRGWAYGEISRYRGGSFAAWLDACEEQAAKLAAYLEPTRPLYRREVITVAGSVAPWVWRVYGTGYERYCEYRRRCGSKGGKATAAKHDMGIIGAKGGTVTAAKHDMADLGQGRKVGSVDKDSESQQKPWETLGISRRTYYNRKLHH